MPKFMPKVPLAQSLLVLPAMLCVALAHLRFSLGGFAKRASFTPMPLTGRCSGLLRNH